MSSLIFIPRRRSVSSAPPASFVFNGTDQYLRRALATSGANTTIFTYSLWAYHAYLVFSPEPFFGAFEAEDGSAARGLTCDSSDADFAGFGVTLRQEESGSLVFVETESVASAPATGWHHWVIRYDSTLGAGGNRIRAYLNGTELTDEAGTQPAQNKSHMLFENGVFHWIGAHAGIAGDSQNFLLGKLAFIDVLEGISADPSAFAFDDGGTWTRKPYAGPRGAYGFALDGSDGFNDVSGNGQHFIGVNMTPRGDLDPGDLPPFII